MTRFFGGLPLFRLNMASMLVVNVIEMGSLAKEVGKEQTAELDKFHFLAYSCNL